MTDSQVVLKAKLDELKELVGAEALSELLQLVMEETPAKLGELKAAIIGRDLEEVRKVSHSLKGSCGNLGLEQMMVISKDLEEISEFPSIQVAEEMFQKLEDLYQEILGTLKCYL
jgi:HPt (histidine-containing phosphotransfer) domain-containing protein